MKALINPDDLKQELNSRGMDHLFHADTVETSITFLRHGHLFTRAHCEVEGYPQTLQDNDNKDKKWGIWDSFFLSFQDSHKMHSKPNFFGPVLFHVNTVRLLEYVVKNGIGVNVTNKPLRTWKETDQPNQRWRTNLKGLFSSPTPLSEVVLAQISRTELSGPDHPGGLPLELVDAITVDNHPSLPNFAPQLISIFTNCAKGHDLKIHIEARNSCKPSCSCKDLAYLEEKDLGAKYELGSWSDKFGKIA